MSFIKKAFFTAFLILIFIGISSQAADKYLMDADFYRIPYEAFAFSVFPELTTFEGNTTGKFSVSETGDNTGFEIPLLWENESGILELELRFKITEGIELSNKYFISTLLRILNNGTLTVCGKNTGLYIEEDVWYDISLKMNLDSKQTVSLTVNDETVEIAYDLPSFMYDSSSARRTFVENHTAEGTQTMYMDYFRLILPGQGEEPPAADPEKEAKKEADRRIVMERIKADLAPTSSDDSSVAEYFSVVTEDGIFSDLNYNSATDRMVHINRVVKICEAYCFENSDYYKDEECLNKAISTMRYFAYQEYAINTIGESGGWDLWITAPSALARAMFFLTLADIEIPEDILYEADTYWFDLCHRNNGNARTFCYALSNCSTTASLWQYLAIVFDDSSYIDLIYDNVLKWSFNKTDGGEYGIEDNETGYKNVRGISYFGDGFYPDWSYLAHGPMHYVFGYGRQLVLGGVNRFIKYAAGTSVQFSEEELSQISGFLLESYRWMIRGSNSEYTGLQRSISGTGTSGLATNGARGDLINFCEALLVEPNIPRRDELIELLSELNENKQQSYVRGNRHYWCSDLMVHHRDGYFAALKLTSNRTLKSEALGTNGTNNYYFSDGQLPIFVTGKEYEKVFPVWDWDRLPGITALQSDDDVPALSSLTETQRFGEKSFAGGASDGNYGVAAMDYHIKEGVNAKKAWFFFDDEIVALGSGIFLDEGVRGEVATSVNQSIKNGDIYYGENGSEALLSELGTVTSDKLEWIHHSDIGYIFPKGQNITVSGAAQTGNGMRKGVAHPSGKTFTRDVFSVTLNNQTDKTEYSYIAVPGKDKEEFLSYAEKLPVEICSNTSDIQAVYNKKLQILQAVFYSAGEAQTSDGLKISVDKPCIVMIRKISGAYAVTLQNPENENISVNFQINKPLVGLTLNENSGMYETVITNRTGLYAGESVTAVYTVSGENIAVYPIQIRDADGNLITTLTSGNAEAKFRLYSTEDKTVKVNTAVYDENGLMISLFTKECALNAGKTSDISISIPKLENITSDCSMRVFIWSDEKNLAPLTNTIQFPERKDG